MRGPPSCPPPRWPASPIPSQPLRDDANEEGGDHAAHRKDGHREGPEGGEGAWWDGAGSLRPLPPQPRLIVAPFDHLGGGWGRQWRSDRLQRLPPPLSSAVPVPCPPCSDGPLCPQQAPHLLRGIDDPNVVAKLQGAKHSREDSEDQGPSDSLLREFPVLGRQKQRGGHMES